MVKMIGKIVGEEEKLKGEMEKEGEQRVFIHDNFVR